uniref:WAP four-disulfide core domain protein 2 n=1 Tax=Nannospalax galili TaxID=1026970 RepID=A0A8C6WBQ0_NANGA
MPVCRLCPPAAGLLGLLLLSLLMAPGTRADKPGVCPELEAGSKCTQECVSDSDCADNRKCCPAGCSSLCSTPNGNPPRRPGLREAGGTERGGGVLHQRLAGCQVSTRPPILIRKQKPGSCPNVDLPQLGICEDQCEIDSQCPGNMKCCRNGCGKVSCVTPRF